MGASIPEVITKETLMIRNHKTRKLALSAETVRRLANLSHGDLAQVAGGVNTQTVCPTVMQTHCYTCYSACVPDE